MNDPHGSPAASALPHYLALAPHAAAPDPVAAAHLDVAERSERIAATLTAPGRERMRAALLAVAATRRLMAESSIRRAAQVSA